MTSNELMTDGDYVFFKNGDSIQSGGYTVNSLLLAQGLSPIATMNLTNDFSFDDLVVPGWALTTNSIYSGGSNQEEVDMDGGAIDTDLYDKLVELASNNPVIRRKKTRHQKKKIIRNSTKKHSRIF